jgi:hypothetical protein
MYVAGRCGTDADEWASKLPRSTKDADPSTDDEGDSVNSSDRVSTSQTERSRTVPTNVKVEADGAQLGNAGPTKKSAGLADNDDTASRLLENKNIRIALQLADLESSGADLPIKVSVWDLGGQQLFQSLQQLFLTKSAIYVIAFRLTHFTEGPSDSDEAAAELRFWCNTVASCVLGNSKGEPGRILVIGTCLDQIKSEGEVDAARRRAADVVGSTLLRGVVAVDDILCVDNSRLDDNKSIAGLRRLLDRYISESFDVKVSVRAPFLV